MKCLFLQMGEKKIPPVTWEAFGEDGNWTHTFYISRHMVLMAWMAGTTSKRKRVSLGWHQGDANSHWFLSSPWAGEIPNDTNLQKVTESPRERYGKSTTISKLYIKNRKGDETSVWLWVFCLVCTIFHSGGWNILLERQRDKAPFSESGVHEWRNNGVQSFWLSASNTCLYTVFLSPPCTLRRSKYLCFISHPDHFWSFSKILVQVSVSCVCLNMKFKCESETHLNILWVFCRRL